MGTSIKEKNEAKECEIHLNQKSKIIKTVDPFDDDVAVIIFAFS